jgi:hypothetical protein
MMADPENTLERRFSASAPRIRLTEEERKARKRERSRVWAAAHPDRSRQWQAANPEKVKASAHRAYEAHKEQRQADQRARHAANRDVYTAKMRERRAANIDEARAKDRRRWAENQDYRDAQLRHMKARRDADPAKVATANRLWREKNKDSLHEKNKTKYTANRDARIASAAQWRRDNLDRAKANLKAWRAANPDYATQRYRDDPNTLIAHRLRARLQIALRRACAGKTARSTELWGCDLATLRQHIEGKFVDSMTWENHSLWHIDHTKPLCQFDLTDPEQQKIAFHYSNLRPLWAAANLARPRKNWRPEQERIV